MGCLLDAGDCQKTEMNKIELGKWTFYGTNVQNRIRLKVKRLQSKKVMTFF